MYYYSVFVNKRHPVFDLITEPLLLNGWASIYSFCINHGLLIDYLYGNDRDPRRPISILGSFYISVAFLIYSIYEQSLINSLYGMYMLLKINSLWNSYSYEKKYDFGITVDLFRVILLWKKIYDIYVCKYVLIYLNPVIILSFVYYYITGINTY